jgi:hypothetical protein
MMMRQGLERAVVVGPERDFFGSPIESPVTPS